MTLTSQIIADYVPYSHLVDLHWYCNSVSVLRQNYQPTTANLWFMGWFGVMNYSIDDCICSHIYYILVHSWFIGKNVWNIFVMICTIYKDDLDIIQDLKIVQARTYWRIFFIHSLILPIICFSQSMSFSLVSKYDTFLFEWALICSLKNICILLWQIFWNFDLIIEMISITVPANKYSMMSHLCCCAASPNHIEMILVPKSCVWWTIPQLRRPQFLTGWGMPFWLSASHMTHFEWEQRMKLFEAFPILMGGKSESSSDVESPGVSWGETGGWGESEVGNWGFMVKP